MRPIGQPRERHNGVVGAAFLDRKTYSVADAATILRVPPSTLRDWCRLTGTKTSYIDPGSPWQNPWVESYGARMRDELLAIEHLDSLLEAQVLVADWRNDYNTYRPHSALGMLTPAEYADQWAKNNQPKLS